MWKHSYLERCLTALNHRRTEGKTKTEQLLRDWALTGREMLKKRHLHAKVMKIFKGGNRKSKAQPTHPQHPQASPSTPALWGRVTWGTIPGSADGRKLGRAQSGWRRPAKRQWQQRSGAGDLTAVQAKDLGKTGMRYMYTCVSACMPASGNPAGRRSQWWRWELIIACKGLSS